jgi:hypothetical protein
MSAVKNADPITGSHHRFTICSRFKNNPHTYRAAAQASGLITYRLADVESQKPWIKAQYSSKTAGRLASPLPNWTRARRKGLDPAPSQKGRLIIMQNRLMKSMCALLMFGLLGALASPALAQERRDYYYGSRVQFRPDVERLLRQAENHTRQFAAMLDDRDRYGLSERAQELESQLNMVGGDFDQRSNYNRRSQVASVIRVAQSINNAMRYRRVGLGFDTQRQWLLVRSDLNRLARVFNLRQIY